MSQATITPIMITGDERDAAAIAKKIIKSHISQAVEGSEIDI